MLDAQGYQPFDPEYFGKPRFSLVCSRRSSASRSPRPGYASASPCRKRWGFMEIPTPRWLPPQFVLKVPEAAYSVRLVAHALRRLAEDLFSRNRLLPFPLAFAESFVYLSWHRKAFWRHNERRLSSYFVRMLLVLSSGLAYAQTPGFTCPTTSEVKLNASEVEMIQRFKAKEDLVKVAKLSLVLEPVLDCIRKQSD